MNKKCIFLLFLMATVLATAQDYIHLQPDQVRHLYLIGSNNVVVRGETVTIQPKSIAEKVRKKIEAKYQSQVDSLTALLDQQVLNIVQHQELMTTLSRQKAEATKAAFVLTEEFKTLDIQKDDALMLAVDSLFRAGSISESLALLSEQSLDTDDRKYAQNRRIKARLHAVNFEFGKAEKDFVRSSEIYPSFEAFEALIGYYLSVDKINDLQAALEKGTDYAKTLEERLYIESGQGLLEINTGKRKAAIARMEKCNELVQQSSRSEAEKERYHAATLLTNSELYGAMPGKKSMAINNAKASKYIFENLIATHGASAGDVLGLISAFHIQAKIHWLNYAFKAAYPAEKAALELLDSHRSNFGDNINFRLLYLDAILMMSSIQMRLEEPEVSESYLTKAIDTLENMYKAQPNLALLSRLVSAQYNLGNQKMYAEKYRAAIQVFNRAEDRYQTLLEVDTAGINKYDYLGKLHNNRGKCHERLGDFDEALANYTQAHFYFTSRLTPAGKIMYDDNSFNAVMNLADTYYQMEDYENAAMYYKKSLYQISLLYGTEPAYWRGIYVLHIFQAGKSHFQVFQSTTNPVEFVESHRHFQSAKTILHNLPKSDLRDSIGLEIGHAQKALLGLFPIFLEKSTFPDTVFLEQLVLKKEREEVSDLAQLTEAYNGFSTSAMEEVVASKSPSYMPESEYEILVNERIYAWWSALLARGYLLQKQFDKAYFAAKSAEKYSKNKHDKTFLALVALLNGDKKKAIEALNAIPQPKAHKMELLEQCLSVLEMHGVLRKSEVGLGKVYKKVK